jgi:hypothetical protein
MVPSNIGIVMGPTLLRPKLESDPMQLITENEQKCNFIANCLHHYEFIFKVTSLHSTANSTLAGESFC